MDQAAKAANMLGARDADALTVSRELDACVGQLGEVSEVLRYRAGRVRSRELAAVLRDQARACDEVHNRVARTAQALTRLQQDLQLAAAD